MRIGINDIEIYKDNPRFVKAENQVEAIKRLVLDDKGRQLVTLAESILVNGQNPLEVVGVIRSGEEGKYIAVEGNRRTLAVKLYFNPDLGNANPSIANAFRALHKKYDGSGITMIDELECHVFDTIEDASHWITLKHTGQNNGEGTVAWNRIQSQRQAIKEGRANPDRGFVLVDWLDSTGHLADVGIETYEDIQNTSTLVRMLDDSSAISRFGMSYANSTIVTVDEDLAVRVIGRIISDLNSNRLPVTKVYTAEDRAQYIDGVMKELQAEHPAEPPAPEDVGIDSTPKPEDEPLEAPPVSLPPMPPVKTVDYTEDDQETGPTPSTASLESRKHLIYRNEGKITSITETKSKAVYDELKKIDCSTYPIATAFLIRDFMEFTCRHFADTCLKRQMKKEEKRHIGTLMSKCIDYVKSAGNESERANCGNITVSTDASGKRTIDDVERLNGVVHCESIIQDKVALLTIWMRYSPFLQDLWNIINRQAKK